MKGGISVYSAVDLSKYIVTMCVNDGCPITNLQLQKILYYTQKDYLDRGCQAFSDPIEAWKFGPVVREAYYYFCGNGAMPIFSKYDTTIKDEDKVYIDPIVCEKRNLDPWELVDDTHKPGHAWAIVFNNGLGYRKIINHDLIRNHG
jgi:uncharacterized phage-associated protein